MSRPPSWIWEFLNFSHISVDWVKTCVRIPNFVIFGSVSPPASLQGIRSMTFIMSRTQSCSLAGFPTILFVVGRGGCPRGTTGCTPPILLSSMLNQRELKQSFCGRMPFPSPTSRNHSLDLIFSLTINLRLLNRGSGVTPFTSAVWRQYPPPTHTHSHIYFKWWSKFLKKITVTQKSNCKQNHPKIRLHNTAAVNPERDNGPNV